MLEETVFSADGSPPPPAVRARLESFRFYHDVINKFCLQRNRHGEPVGLDDTVFTGDPSDADLRLIHRMDSWFLDRLGGSIYFSGNEGTGEEMEYSCYVLVAHVGRTEASGSEERPDSESGSGDADEESAGVRHSDTA
jgi:hypothetical protein